MKAMKVVPGTRLKKLIKKYKKGDTSVLPEIMVEVTTTAENQGLSGMVAISIDDITKEEVPTRLVSV